MGMFDHVKGSRRETAECVLFELEGDPTIVVKYAGEGNKPYFNAILKQTEEWQRRKRKFDEKMIKDNRDRDLALFPLHVVVGWKNVKDRDGKEVPFTPENLTEYFLAIGDEQFDVVRNFAKDASNFRDFVNTGDTAGNSPSA